MQLNNKSKLFQFQNIKNFLAPYKIPGHRLLFNMQKLASFLKKSTDIISVQTASSITNLITKIQTTSQNESPRNKDKYKGQPNIQQQNQQHAVDIIPLTTDKIAFDRPLQGLQLEQSKILNSQNKSSSVNQIKRQKSIKSTLKSSMSNSRIKQIQDQKRKILQQLKKLDGEISQIKKDKQGAESLQKSKFHKKVQIADDAQAKRQAQSLIKQLHLQKMKMQQKKRKMQQKQLQQKKREEQQKKKERQELQRKLRQEKRQLIEKRMEEERKKREQRRLIDKQANSLISQLKKEQQLQKQSQLIPGQIMEYQQKKKLLQKKNIFNISEIQDHQKKYKQLKSKQKQLRRQRSQSTKVSHPIPKYGKNIWVERIQQQENKRKQQQKIRQINKRMQLQKRMKYGDIVKNIFKSKQKKKSQSIQKTSKQHSQFQQQISQKKPRTPDVNNHLPPIPKSEQKRQNQTDNKFKQRHQSNSIIQDKQSRVIPKPLLVKEKDPQELQKIQKQKQRQLQLRKQTKQRLKKLQNKSIDIPKPQKVKYENYISKVKVKKSDPHDEWKRIMSNEKLSKQQKYKQMLNKAAFMQNQAKIKQDLRKNGDEDAVNLYIGSIQAKLALLQKF